MEKDKTGIILQTVKTQISILAVFVGLMWAIEIADQVVFAGQLDILGIHPRTTSGLQGILFMPFLHGGFGHLMANTVPFLVLGWLIMLRETKDFFIVTLLSMVIGGLGVWLVGAPRTVHIGASGLVFGYLGFLLLRGYFERSMISIAISLGVGVFYGSMIFGVLPIYPGVSWEGHLFGFLGGVFAAYLLGRRPAKGNRDVDK